MYIITLCEILGGNLTEALNSDIRLCSKKGVAGESKEKGDERGFYCGLSRFSRESSIPRTGKSGFLPRCLDQ